MEQENVFTVPPQSPGLNPADRHMDAVKREIHNMDEQLTNVQQLCDATISI